eukprot:TRINITY_DN13634_c0_g1_i1.p1 TRINITY_DN13634_c0_g1~~TRINITY_DN13634_c0_g1_i1.p1  ORF type:complete len:146 (-),score=58.85 TRINITY_DN13634_c0_g1_i1:62-439(-)
MLVFFSLVSMAMAAPQYYQYPIYQHGYPLYQPSYPLAYPGRVAPVYPGYPYPAAPIPSVDSRLSSGPITFSSLLQVAGTMEKDTTTTPARTVAGTVEFHQNFLTGSNSKYKIYLNGADMANRNTP